MNTHNTLDAEAHKADRSAKEAAQLLSDARQETRTAVEMVAAHLAEWEKELAEISSLLAETKKRHAQELEETSWRAEEIRDRKIQHDAEMQALKAEQEAAAKDADSRREQKLAELVADLKRAGEEGYKTCRKASEEAADRVGELERLIAEAKAKNQELEEAAAAAEEAATAAEADVAEKLAAVADPDIALFRQNCPTYQDWKKSLVKAATIETETQTLAETAEGGLGEPPYRGTPVSSYAFGARPASPSWRAAAHWPAILATESWFKPLPGTAAARHDEVVHCHTHNFAGHHGDLNSLSAPVGRIKLSAAGCKHEGLDRRWLCQGTRRQRPSGWWRPRTARLWPRRPTCGRSGTCRPG